MNEPYNQDSWKNKKVVFFEWKEYHGFIPSHTGVVVEETESECLVKLGWRNEVWTLKFSEKINNLVASKCGYCKLIF